MKTNLFLAFLLINSVFLQSQSPNDLQKKIITEVATYRATLLEQNIKNSWQLLPNLNKLDTANLEQYQSKVIDIMNASVGIGQRLLFTVNLGEELIKRKANQTSVFDEFSDFEMDIVSKNLDLVDLTRERLLEAQYPFKIVRNARLLQELTFFNVQEKDKVGEIGAAAGTRHSSNLNPTVMYRFFVMVRFLIKFVLICWILREVMAIGHAARGLSFPSITRFTMGSQAWVILLHLLDCSLHFCFRYCLSIY